MQCAGPRATAAEVQRYLAEFAAEHGLLPRVKFGAEVVEVVDEGPVGRRRVVVARDIVTGTVFEHPADVVVFAAGYYPLQLPTSVKEQHGAVHLGFVDAAETLHEHGLEGAAMNAELRAHWRAYNDTGREGRNARGSFKVFEKRDPPSEPFPESLRALVPAATAASTA